MKCLLCGREIFNEEDAKWINEDDVVCPQCSLIVEKVVPEENDYSETVNNKTGSTIQIVAMFLWILGGISVVAFCILINDFSFSAMMLGLFAVFTSGLMVYGLGEIIILLGQINSKMPKKRK
jgi:DNA-directed RNA polymerase subunit RPC12/RpoP